MHPKQIAAFFDFDKTLIEIESGKVGLDWLKERRMLSAGYLLKIMIANILFKTALISEERLIRILMTFYKGRKLADFEAGADTFYRDCLASRLAPNMVSRLDDHKSRGHLPIIVSGSIRYWLKPAAADLGFGHILSTDLEVGSDGLLTGNPRGPICIGENKRRFILSLAQKERIDLENSYAYGNHESDVPQLEAVGNPYAVEPTAALKKIAVERGWPILTFR